MVFGRIYDSEPQPTFFNVRYFKNDPTYKKARSRVRRGVVLFMDAQPVKFKSVRQRPFSGSFGSIAQSRSKPSPLSYYQQNKILLSQMNKKVIERKQEQLDPLKLAELALLNKINENLEKKQTSVSIAQTEPTTDDLEQVEQVTRARQEVLNLEELNDVLINQLKDTRTRMNELQGEVRAIAEADEADRRGILQRNDAMMEERVAFEKERVKESKTLVQERIQRFEKIASGGGLPVEEVEVEEAPVTEALIEGGFDLERIEAKEREIEERLQPKKGKKPRKKVTKKEQDLITNSRLLTTRTRALERLKLDNRNDKRNLPKKLDKLKILQERLKEQVDKNPDELTRGQKISRTKRIQDLESDVRFTMSEAEGLQQNISQYKVKKQNLQNLIKEGEANRPFLYTQVEDEEQQATLRN